MLTLTALAFVIGLLSPTVTGWPVPRHLIALRAHRRLHPLWRAYVEAEPDIALEDNGKTRLRDIEFGLSRRIIEIPDGMLTLSPYAVCARAPARRVIGLLLAVAVTAELVGRSF